ncbi:MAG: nodulation protein NfeD, partial [Gammaproteobacteria bacterium]|nr:nodulation protein NfeD [Gammaproteobacteria bacterium]
MLADNGGNTTTPQVRVVELEGAIGPASADYFMRALERGDEDGIDLLVLRLDTPGGLDKSMRDMIKAILASPVPVATYVAPNGSRAASAGTYIMYASHIAAMAPATNIGSSTPVNLGGEGSPLPIPTAPQPPADEGEPGGDESGSKDGQDGEAKDKAASGSAMDRKVVNDAVSYIKGLAELRGRNAEWAEATVREASN